MNISSKTDDSHGLTPVTKLNNDSVYIRSVYYNFSQGSINEWDVILPSADDWTAEQCKEYLDDIGNDYPSECDPWTMSRAELIADLESIAIACYDEESDELLREAYLESVTSEDLYGLDGWRETANKAIQNTDYRYRPAMNYFYAFPDQYAFTENDALKIINLPLVIVYFEKSERYALVLTGGGMNLSWEICGAFMALGFLPPLHFCGLPLMAGLTLTDSNQWIINGCKRSVDIAIGWAQSTRNDLDRIETTLKEEIPCI